MNPDDMPDLKAISEEMAARGEAGSGSADEIQDISEEIQRRGADLGEITKISSEQAVQNNSDRHPEE